MRIYESRDAALRAKWATAKALGVTERDLVVVRHGAGYAIRTKASLERWLAGKRAA